MKEFGGYTVRSLLDEPFTVFLRLAEISDAIQADEALELVYQPLVAALNGNDAEYLATRREHGMYVIDPELYRSPRHDELERARQLAARIEQGDYKTIARYSIRDVGNPVPLN